MDQNEQKSLKQIIDYRIEKINQLRDNGIEPYPYNFKKEYDVCNVLSSVLNIDKVLILFVNE